MRPERHVIQQRDESVVVRLFHKHGEHLTRHLTRLLGSTALAQEAVQDAYEQLCKMQLETIENPAGYFFRVGVRFALMHRRRAKLEAEDLLQRIPLEDNPDNVPAPETLAIQDQNIRHLREQITLLSPPLRQVIELRHLQGMGASDIIKKLGISEFVYERRLTAAKRQLGQRLRELGADPLAL